VYSVHVKQKAETRERSGRLGKDQQIICRKPAVYGPASIICHVGKPQADLHFASDLRMGRYIVSSVIVVSDYMAILVMIVPCVSRG
jgi:hypothetical protein